MGDRFVNGRRGSGKSFLGAFWAWLDWLDGRQIWSNMWLHPAFDYNHITKQKGNYKFIDAVDLIMLLQEDIESQSSLLEELQKIPKTLILDEVKTQAGKRVAGSWINRHLVDFIAQARKRNFTVIYIDQIINAYDIDMRRLTEDVIFSLPTININDLGLGTIEYPEPQLFSYYNFNIDYRTVTNQWHIKRSLAREFYPLFKTGQMITPVDMKYDIKALKEFGK